MTQGGLVAASNMQIYQYSSSRHTGYLLCDAFSSGKLNPNWVKDAKIVVTAGVPAVLVDDVIEALKRLGPLT